MNNQVEASGQSRALVVADLGVRSVRGASASAGLLAQRQAILLIGNRVPDVRAAELVISLGAEAEGAGLRSWWCGGGKPVEEPTLGKSASVGNIGTGGWAGGDRGSICNLLDGNKVGDSEPDWVIPVGGNVRGVALAPANSANRIIDSLDTVGAILTDVGTSLDRWDVPVPGWAGNFVV